jgi:hypothetical protein
MICLRCHSPFKIVCSKPAWFAENSKISFSANQANDIHGSSRKIKSRNFNERRNKTRDLDGTYHTLRRFPKQHFKVTYLVFKG